MLPSWRGLGLGFILCEKAMSIEATRRAFLAALIGISVGLSATGALADSDDGGGSSGSNSGSNSGSGSSNSGSGKDSEEDSDDSDDDSDEDEDARIGSLEASAAKAAVSAGKAVSLTKLIEFIKRNYPGKILDVDLKRSSGRYQYRIKILQVTGKVVKLRLDAMTLQML
jgi:uncharacterized membrane protein YkoI